MFHYLNNQRRLPPPFPHPYYKHSRQKTRLSANVQALLFRSNPMEVIVKARPLLASILFLFAHSPTTQAQETLDLAKITCDQFAGEKLAAPSHDVVLWLSGYYNGERHNTIIEPQAIKKHDDQISLYCLNHRDTTVMDAVKNVLGLEK